MCAHFFVGKKKMVAAGDQSSNLAPSNSVRAHLPVHQPLKQLSKDPNYSSRVGSARMAEH